MLNSRRNRARHGGSACPCCNCGRVGSKTLRRRERRTWQREEW